ncbi:protein of unknown function [Tenacibaculum aestuariivivum]
MRAIFLLKFIKNKADFKNVNTKMNNHSFLYLTEKNSIKLK